MDQTLVKNLDDAAWSRLLAETIGSVLRELNGVPAGLGDREDVAAEVAERLLRYRRAAMTADAFRRLARRIARNCVVDRYRAGHRERELTSELAKGSSARRRDHHDEDAEQHQHLKDVLIDILATIPLETRWLLWMRIMDGATFDQIAKAQSMSTTTVRRRITEAVTQLEAALQARRVDDQVLDELLTSMKID